MSLAHSLMLASLIACKHDLIHFCIFLPFADMTLRTYTYTSTRKHRPPATSLQGHALHPLHIENRFESVTLIHFD